MLTNFNLRLKTVPVLFFLATTSFARVACTPAQFQNMFPCHMHVWLSSKCPVGLSDRFSGLLKIASTTGAWLVSGGTNAGVMKLVGEVLEGQAHSQGTLASEHRLVAIGFATWGIVSNKHLLVQPNPQVKGKCLSFIFAKLVLCLLLLLLLLLFLLFLFFVVVVVVQSHQLQKKQDLKCAVPVYTRTLNGP